ncbi:hypothetical protein SS1G_10962 [Sclerotinia sclerotiorum 1980 UF-70]|uniref:hypothetical protein n=1 Tax=Sclerotinia sclerotiorum (strain ATCC 18683 / 1980 / Ss-1) TaxID=665079 RepID=UPI00015A002A|nr:hypothetical protein SS1G_10962 [Sclerotinia sclerotiorum 1980 UF-70]EDN95087.1 hypothetical protein SS1G_10962 [Sclerotinia sclerotiorum 1980 UF-70]
MTTVDIGRYKRLVQYFWDPEPTNNIASKSPIWCLGEEYLVSDKSSPSAVTESPPKEGGYLLAQSLSTTETTTPPDSTVGSLESSSEYDNCDTASTDGGWPTAFLDDFEAKIWLTYRSNFPAIAKSQDPKALSAMSLSVRLRSQLVDQGGFTSDTGWGCSSSNEERKILSLFADDPRAPYSIHKFVEHGASACGKHPGEWFGPSAAARCIQALTNSQVESELRVYITGDGSDVYEDTFMSIAKPNSTKFTPTLILVGTRLGLDKITPVYWEALKSSLQMPQSVGIAGGRPSSSHYFIGVQESDFFYLDPHQTRPALPFNDNVEDYTPEDIDSCHTRRLRRLHIKEMDPSMLIAFLIRDENDWKDWRRAVREVQGKGVIHVADRDPALHGLGAERDGAIDEVETFDDDDDDTVLNG